MLGFQDDMPPEATVVTMKSAYLVWENAADPYPVLMPSPPGWAHEWIKIVYAEVSDD
jgi:hypothetical protein